MGKLFSELNPSHRQFIADQKIFFTATAMGEGRINLSPKGLDAFRVMDARRVCFLNLTGSGNETDAHLLGDGRITVMFCSFEKKPLILRIYGQGRYVHQRDAEWSTLLPLFPDLAGKRQFILIDVASVHTSCGYGVPFFDYRSERETLSDWGEKKGEKGIRNYWEANNRVSIDGFPTRILD